MGKQDQKGIRLIILSLGNEIWHCVVPSETRAALRGVGLEEGGVSRAEGDGNIKGNFESALIIETRRDIFSF